MIAALPVQEVLREASRAEILRCHDEGYVDTLRSIDGPTLIGLDTLASETTWRAVTLAAGVALDAVERDAFALLRPPGHHATRDEAMGFCFLNHAALAVRHAQAALGVGRVAVVDWDVHHANGTQEIFAADESVFVVSIHRYGRGFYPGTGGPHEQGRTLLNVPLPAGAGDREYAAAFAERVEPRVRAWDPELVVVSAGFDAWARDPLGGMAVTAEGFRDLARRSAVLAPRTAAVLEGGYDVDALPRLVEAAAEGFTAD